MVAEHGWALNPQPASYEQLHLSMLAGLLGNIGFKPEEEDVYLGARGIKFHRHPGAHLRKKPGRWIVCAEAGGNHAPVWPGHGRHRAAMAGRSRRAPVEEATARSALGEKSRRGGGPGRATLYGLVVYSGRRMGYDKVDPHAAREMFIRQALVAGDVLPDWHQRLPFLAANEKLIAKVEEQGTNRAARTCWWTKN